MRYVMGDLYPSFGWLKSNFHDRHHLSSGERRMVGSEIFLEGARGEGWIAMILIACDFKKVYETTALR